MIFGKRKTPAFDPSGMIPTIHASICTGERVAGFKDPATGKFFDLVYLRSDRDLQDFLHTYHLSENDIQKEW